MPTYAYARRASAYHKDVLRQHDKLPSDPERNVETRPMGHDANDRASGMDPPGIRAAPRSRFMSSVGHYPALGPAAPCPVCCTVLLAVHAPHTHTHTLRRAAPFVQQRPLYL